MIAKDLLKALALAKPFVAKRSSRPILECVLLRQNKGWLTIEATNLDYYCRVPVRYDSEEFGPAVVGASVLERVLKAFAKQDISIAVHHDVELSITSADNTTTIGILHPVDGWLAWPTGKAKPLATFDADVLSQVASRVAPSAAQDDSRPTLTGVNCEFSVEVVVFATTDGYEMASLEIGPECNYYGHGEVKALIPARSFAPIAKLAEPEDECSVSHSDDFVFFEMGSGAMAATRIMEGTFPQWREVMDRKSGFVIHCVLVQTDEIRRVLRLLKGLHSKGVGVVSMKTGLEELSLSTKAISGYQVEMTQRIEATVASVAGTTSHVSIGRALGFISRFKDPYVRIYLNDNDMTPIVFEPMLETDKFRGLLMPMKAPDSGGD